VGTVGQWYGQDVFAPKTGCREDRQTAPVPVIVNAGQNPFDQLAHISAALSGHLLENLCQRPPQPDPIGRVSSLVVGLGQVHIQ
jgi:hypothetical protein